MIAALYFVKISIKQKLQMPGATERNIAGISECSPPHNNGLSRITAGETLIEEDDISQEIPNY